ncbi:MAG: dihydrolipoyl dehydrogenase [gamma proteobacterium endosymbiont of Trioza apicalis]
MNNKDKKNVVIIGGGPAGYSAAFRCADLGLNTTIIERYKKLGGVCLNVGCIPSKALLHISKIMDETKTLEKSGIKYNKPNININKIKKWKEKIIKNLTNGLNYLSKLRKIKIINGTAEFIKNNTINVKNKNETKTINFDDAIIATGSNSNKLSLIKNDDYRIWNSTDALNLKYIPKNMLIIGGGIIGLEMSNIYQSLGSKIDIIELSNQIIPMIDKDIAFFFTKQIESKINLMLETKIIKIEKTNKGLYVHFKQKKLKKQKKYYDAILVAIGRKPNIKLLNLDKVGININKNNFICVDKQMRTNISNIYAIGDVIGQPMLAHKGIHEGHIAAEVISGKKNYFEPKVIPYISYTNPEIAWVGLSEKEAKKNNISYEIAIFPWIASGRAIASNCSNGITKLIFNKKNNKIIGGALVGINSGELLGEISLAIEMGCNAKDIALTIHAHPTLYESIGMAAKIYEGTITDLYNNKLK